MAGNTPFKYCKQIVHNGGIADALIITWPKGIQAKGEIRNQYGFVTDIMATALEVTGTKFMPEIDGVKQMPIDGISLMYSLRQGRGAFRAHRAVLRAARQSRDVQGRLEGGHDPRQPHAVGGRRHVSLRQGRLGALQPERGLLRDQRPRGEEPREAGGAEEAVGRAGLEEQRVSALRRHREPACHAVQARLWRQEDLHLLLARAPSASRRRCPRRSRTSRTRSRPRST